MPLLALIAWGAVVTLVLVILTREEPRPFIRGDDSILLNGEVQTVVGDGTALTSNMREFSQSVWLGADDGGRIVDVTELTCHGGLAHVTWHVGDLEPTVKDAGIHLSARLDGEPIGSVLRGTSVDNWGDDPADLHAVIDCPAGTHRLDLLIRSIHGIWGFPYVVNPGDPPSPDLRVGRGFVVTEVWEP